MLQQEEERFLSGEHNGLQLLSLHSFSSLHSFIGFMINYTRLILQFQATHLSSLDGPMFHCHKLSHSNYSTC